MLKVQCRGTRDLGSFLWALQRRTNKIPHRSKYLTVLQYLSLYRSTVAFFLRYFMYAMAMCKFLHSIRSLSPLTPNCLLLIAYCISFPPLPSLSSSPSSQLRSSVQVPIPHSPCTDPTQSPIYCTDIIELPFNVFAMDHLSGVQDRHSYNFLEGTHREEKKELKEVGEGEGGIMFYAFAFY